MDNMCVDYFKVKSKRQKLTKLNKLFEWLGVHSTEQNERVISPEIQNVKTRNS